MVATKRKRSSTRRASADTQSKNRGEAIAKLFDLNPPSATIEAEWQALRDELDDVLPAKQLDQNVLIATWNIRHFGGLTDKWTSREGDQPRRDCHSLVCIAEIVSRFDVVALQEVKGELKALRRLMKLLGPNWGMILTDVNGGDRGNDERMAYLFDTRRVRPSGLAGELVVPEKQRRQGIRKNALERQFARSPYAVAFITGNCTFILVTLHMIYGRETVERIKELQAIADWMAGWASEIQSWGHNLIVLGDFNIDRLGDEAYTAFTSSGLQPPEKLKGAPRTIFGDSCENKYYDQIAWFTGESGAPLLSLKYNHQAGYFDFVKTLLTLSPNRQVTVEERRDLSWRISDHYPLWTEFLIGDG